MRALLPVVFIGAFTSAGPVAAQTDLTERDFVDRVTAGHPAVRAVGEQLGIAEAARRRAGLFSNPRVGFEREQPDGGPRQDTWSVAWIPPLPWQFLIGRQAASAALEAERLRFGLERQRVRQDARGVYAAWSVAEARREVLRRHAEQLASMADKARQRAESGEESGLSARRLGLAAAEVRAELASAEAERERSLAEARAWQVDLAPDARPALPLLPESSEIPAGIVTLEARAFEADRDHAKAALRLTKRFWEAPELTYGRQKLTGAGPEASGPAWGVSWAVPLFDRKQPERALAARRLEIAEARLALGARRAETQARAAASSYRALLAGVRAIEPDIRQPEDLMEAAIASYRAGESTVTDLLDTLDGIRSASTRWLALYEETHAAHRALELAIAQPEGDRR
jgi:outer membrane protein TolC